MTPLDRLHSRTESLREQVLSGTPIDYRQREKLDAIDAVANGIYYVEAAILRTVEADTESNELHRDN